MTKVVIAMPPWLSLQSAPSNNGHHYMQAKAGMEVGNGMKQKWNEICTASPRE